MVSASSVVWRVNRTPRFSAMDLGEYMALEDDARETRRRAMKYERMAPTLMYRDLYPAVASFLCSPTRDRRILGNCRTLLSDAITNATSPQARENATYALRALDTFEGSLNALPLGGVQFERAPVSRKRDMGGAWLTIQPTVLVKVARPRGKALRGALIIDVAKGTEPKSDELKRRATNAMSYTAILLHELAIELASADERASLEHCLVFHTNRQELVAAPSNYKKMLRNMVAACRTAVAHWPDIAPPASFDPKAARYRD